MSPDLARPLGLAALAAPVLAVAVWRRWPPRSGPRAAQIALGVRVVVLTSLALALAGLEVGTTPGAQTLVAAVDRSASPLGALGGEAATVRAMISAKARSDRVGVVAFGQSAAVENPPRVAPDFSAFGTRTGPDFTDVEAALRLSGSLMSAEARRHVVVVSDGRQNVGDAVSQARLLRAEGDRVDVLPLSVPTGPEVRVDDVVAPGTVALGARPQVRVDVSGNVATPGRVRVELDGAVVSDEAVSLSPGQSSRTFVLPPAGPGFHTVRALLDPRTDTITENNVGEALYQVLGAQRVLVIEGQPGEAANVAAALRAASMPATVIEPAQTPVTAGQVAAYQAVALVDVSADELGPTHMAALATATRALGVGLAAFGGTDTFGPGGLSGTPLESALPIDMRIPSRSVKAPVAVVLVLESVENPSGDAVVRGAARSLVDHLAPTDQVGVTDAQEGFAVPLQPLSNRAKVESAITNIPSFGDPPSYVPYLTDAANALARLPNATKHIIVLGDGDTPQLPSPDFMAALVRQGITVSAVGVDVHGQAQFMAAMQSIATEGKGRFYQSESASQIPDIFLDETRTSLEPWIVQERFRPSPGVPGPALAGVDPTALPPLDGYVASTPKASAEVDLGGPNGDPILAEWTYGAGRAAAWTSDTSGRWTSALLGSPQAGRLLADVVASTLPLAANPALQVAATVEGDQLHVLAQLTSPVPAGTATGTVVFPDGTTTEIGLVGTGPGRYEADLPASEVGSYLVRVAISSGERLLEDASAGVAVAYSPEYRFIGTDRTALAAMAKAGGGRILSEPGQVFAVPVPPVRAEHSLLGWLLGLAALLLPLDVAVRRLTLRPGDAAAWQRIVVRRPATPAGASDPTIDRLRQRVNRARVDAQRRRSDAADAAPPSGDQPEPDTDLATRLLSRRRDAGPG